MVFQIDEKNYFYSIGLEKYLHNCHCELVEEIPKELFILFHPKWQDRPKFACKYNFIIQIKINLRIFKTFVLHWRQ